VVKEPWTTAELIDHTIGYASTVMEKLLETLPDEG
jgi:hypothetical protein